jgi:hypothetical protein
MDDNSKFCENKKHVEPWKVLGEGFPIVPRMPPNSNVVFNLGFSKELIKKWINNQ